MRERCSDVGMIARRAWLLVLVAAAARAETAGRVDEFVRAEMARQKVPGVAVAVVDHGKAVKVEGYANVEHDVPVRPETVFQSGSLGKQFTAATVMTLGLELEFAPGSRWNYSNTGYLMRVSSCGARRDASTATSRSST